MKVPIYIKSGALERELAVKLSRDTGRPVVFVYGDPREVVYDVQEDTFTNASIAAMQGLLANSQLKLEVNPTVQDACNYAEALITELDRRAKEGEVKGE